MSAFRVSRQTALFFMIAVIAFILFVGVFSESKGIGRTDLRILFIITDAVTGEFLSDVSVQLETILADEELAAHAMSVSLKSNESGEVDCDLKEVQFTSSNGILGSKYSFQLPDWRITVSKQGYKKEVISNFNSVQHGRNVIRDHGILHIEVPVHLNR
ncbi:hypothetical protein [Thalassoglobus sp.]|uniref:hypothetical protein n=1 Tax=Thalassoglobus sp. TaxID=2795869 RepID=UPI003AA9BB4F